MSAVGASLGQMQFFSSPFSPFLVFLSFFSTTLLQDGIPPLHRERKTTLLVFSAF